MEQFDAEFEAYFERFWELELERIVAMMIDEPHVIAGVIQEFCRDGGILAAGCFCDKLRKYCTDSEWMRILLFIDEHKNC